jgi:hypothetical protein
MANVSRKQGFLPVRTLDNASWDGATQLFYVDSADGTAIFVGDAVKYGSPFAGGAGKTIAGFDCEGLASVISVGTGTINAGTSIVGVAVGFSVDPTARYQRSRLASTNRLVYVAPALSTIFEIEEDAVTTPIGVGGVGQNASFTGGTGDTTLFTSTSVIISTSVATTATLPLRIMGLAKRPNNALNAAGAGSDPGKYQVFFNASGVSAGGAGILAHS